MTASLFLNFYRYHYKHRSLYMRESIIYGELVFIVNTEFNTVFKDTRLPLEVI